MTKELKYVTFNTSLGWIGILGSTSGLRRITLPQISPQEARRLLGNSINCASWSHEWFEGIMERLETYCSGNRVTFSDELDLSSATVFQRRVWEATRLIPYGSTRSYQWVAEKITKSGAARAVGQALARNPLPIIVPCHRVLKSNGSPGGYSGGIETKQYLLHLEASATTTDENHC